MKLQSNYQLQTFLAVATEQKSEMTSYLNNGYDVINCFAKFEKFLPHNNNTKFYVCRKSNARVRPGGFLPPPPPIKNRRSKIPHNLGLTLFGGGSRVRDKVAISAYVFKIVEKDSFLRL